MTSTLIPPLIGAAGLLVAVIIYGIVRRYDAGTSVKIADAIHEGAGFHEARVHNACCLCLGSVCGRFLHARQVNTRRSPFSWAHTSACAGWFGMFGNASQRQNYRSSQRGPGCRIVRCLYGGSIMGLAVASLGLMGLGLVYLYFGNDRRARTTYMGSAWGFSSSFVSRVGGAFTQRALMLALTCCSRSRVFEDDPRPGVIADNVGIMLATSQYGFGHFESYCGSAIATINRINLAAGSLALVQAPMRRCRQH